MNAYQSPSFVPAVRLVAGREIGTKLRSKSFVISTVVLLVVILASVVVSSLFSANPGKTSIAAVGSAVATAEQLGAFDVEEVADAAAAEKLVKAGDVDAAVIPDSSPAGVRVVALDEEPSGVIAAFSVAPEVSLLDPSDTDGFLAYFVAIGFGLVFFMSAITFGQTIAQSVVEEKQTRIVEILMATVPVRALLAGKVIGNSVLAFGQIVIIAALAAIGLLATGQNLFFAELGPSIAWFVVFFAVGFVMLASLYSATAALVSRQEDLATAVSPVTTLVMLPYFAVIFFNDNPVVLTVMSYIPFSAPVGMPMRVFLGEAAWWEPLLSLGVLIASTVVIVLLGSRIYANGLLRMGAKVKLLDAVRAG